MCLIYKYNKNKRCIEKIRTKRKAFVFEIILFNSLIVDRQHLHWIQVIAEYNLILCLIQNNQIFCGVGFCMCVCVWGGVQFIKSIHGFKIKDRIKFSWRCSYFSRLKSTAASTVLKWGYICRLVFHPEVCPTLRLEYFSSITDDPNAPVCNTTPMQTLSFDHWCDVPEKVETQWFKDNFALILQWKWDNGRWIVFISSWSSFSHKTDKEKRKPCEELNIWLYTSQAFCRLWNLIQPSTLI